MGVPLSLFNSSENRGPSIESKTVANTTTATSSVSISPVMSVRLVSDVAVIGPYPAVVSTPIATYTESSRDKGRQGPWRWPLGTQKSATEPYE